MFKKEIKDLKDRDEQHNNCNEKNTVEGINSRITEAEQMSELEDRVIKITAIEQNKEKMKWGKSQRPLG